MSGFTDMTPLERSHAELRAALRLAGKEIVKLNFGKSDTPLLVSFAPCCGRGQPSAGVLIG
jgi:hypothetical protein